MKSIFYFVFVCFLQCGACGVRVYLFLIFFTNGKLEVGYYVSNCLVTSNNKRMSWKCGGRIKKMLYFPTMAKLKQ